MPTERRTTLDAAQHARDAARRPGIENARKELVGEIRGLFARELT